MEIGKRIIGILILFGGTRGRNETIKCIWNEDRTFCQRIFRATIGSNAFKDIMNFFRTDNHKTRQQPKTRNKFEAIREIWEIFTNNCQSVQCLNCKCTYVNKKLVGFRGRCLFRVYMKSKPDYYDIKIWAKCRNPSEYVCNSQVCTSEISSALKKSKDSVWC